MARPDSDTRTKTHNYILTAVVLVHYILVRRSDRHTSAHRGGAAPNRGGAGGGAGDLSLSDEDGVSHAPAGGFRARSESTLEAPYSYTLTKVNNRVHRRE